MEINIIKKIILSSVLFSSLLYSANISDSDYKEYLENNMALFHFGGDFINSGTENNSNGSSLTTNNGFEVAIGSEEKVQDFEFGTKTILNMYFNDISKYTNGSYSADIKNSGLEISGFYFYKATKFFKPYIGAGFGLDFGSYNDHGAYLTESTYQPTLHGIIGVSGQLLGPLGYYAQYKYTVANSFQKKAYINGSSITIENNALAGSSTIVGIEFIF